MRGDRPTRPEAFSSLIKQAINVGRDSRTRLSDAQSPAITDEGGQPTMFYR